MCTAKTTNAAIWHTVTFQKKAIAVCVAAVLALVSSNLYAAEGAAGGITVGAAVTLSIVGLGLIAVAADDDGIDPPTVGLITTSTTTSSKTITTATSTTGT